MPGYRRRKLSLGKAGGTTRKKAVGFTKPLVSSVLEPVLKDRSSVESRVPSDRSIIGGNRNLITPGYAPAGAMITR